MKLLATIGTAKHLQLCLDDVLRTLAEKNPRLKFLLEGTNPAFLRELLARNGGTVIDSCPAETEILGIGFYYVQSEKLPEIGGVISILNKIDESIGFDTFMPLDLVPREVKFPTNAEAEIIREETTAFIESE
jgi:hypothetical protein